jgi:hypothetical protein
MNPNLAMIANFMVGIRGRSFSVPELAGVRRLSLATSDYRAAMTGFLNAVSKKQVAGQFGLLDRCGAQTHANLIGRHCDRWPARHAVTSANTHCAAVVI